MSDPEQAAALLQSPPGWNDANDLDEKLQQIPGVPGATASWLLGWAERLDENSGITPAFSEALREAAAVIASAASQLGSVVGGGIMRDAGTARPFDPQGRELTRWLSARDPDWQNGNQRRSWTG